MNVDEIIATTKAAWTPPMAEGEYGAFLNRLLEAERAGAKLVGAYLDELPIDSDEWGQLRIVQRDEARNCAVLIHLLLQVGIAPSTAIGDFHRKGLEISGLRERLQFLNRGQRWVARHIAEALPRIRASAAKSALRAMHESHVANVALCEELLEGEEHAG